MVSVALSLPASADWRKANGGRYPLSFWLFKAVKSGLSSLFKAKISLKKAIARLP